jgi:hypothetical protein
MNVRINSVIVSGAFLLTASALGVFAVPAIGPMFADIFPGQTLPWPTLIVVTAGLAAFIALALSGAALLVLTDAWRRVQWVHSTLIVVLTFALAFTIVALARPLMMLLENTV